MIEQTPYPAVSISPEGKTLVINAGAFSTQRPYPTEPGIYQLRPVGRMWSVDGPEHAAWIPIFRWATGILALEEIPELHELPELGQAYR